MQQPIPNTVWGEGVATFRVPWEPMRPSPRQYHPPGPLLLPLHCPGPGLPCMAARPVGLTAPGMSEPAGVKAVSSRWHV